MSTQISGDTGVSAVQSVVVAQGALATNVVGNGPVFRARLNSSQNLTNGVSAKINFDTEDFDTDNCFSSGRLTPTVAGYYQINASLYALVSAGTLTYAAIGILRNGTEIGWSVDRSTTFSSTYLSISALVYLNGSTDYIELWAIVSGSSPVLQGGQLTNVSGFLARAA